MSRQFRYRVTAIVLGGFFLGVPLLTNGTADAEQFGVGARQVTFEGGGIFSCRSRPDTGAITVPMGSTVRVVNRTGHQAELWLGGVTRGSLRDDTATDVVFRRGTTSLGLEPDCADRDDATPVQVTAAMPETVPVTMSSPLPVPTLPVPAVGPHRPGGAPQRPGGHQPPVAVSPGPDLAGPVQPPPTKPSVSHHSSAARPPATHSSVDRPKATGSSLDRPKATGSSVDRAKATRSSTDRPRATHSSGSRSPRSRPHVWRTKTRSHHATTRPPTKIKVKTPMGTAEAPGGRAGGTSALPAVPGVDLPTTAAEPRAGAKPTTRLASSESAAAEPVAAMRPIPVANRIGLLGVIATVCAVGVTIAAIRSIVSQRANRPIVA